MAFVFANRGLFHLMNVAISGSTDIRQAAFTDAGTAPTAATIRDLNFLDGLTAIYTEAAASGYARADLASVTLTESDASDNVTLTAAAPTQTAVAVGEVWEAVAYYIEGASDAARVLIGVDTPTTPITTNGGDITMPALSVTVTGS
jgi:hypothetical protein